MAVGVSTSGDDTVGETAWVEIFLRSSFARSSRQCSASRLEIPSPVCCQNCFAIPKALEGNRVMCRFPHSCSRALSDVWVPLDVDGRRLDVRDESLSGHIMKWTSRTDPIEGSLRSINSRHAAAQDSSGKSMQRSEPSGGENFFSHNCASCYV